MNKYQWDGKWHQLKGRIRQEWSDLTEEEIDAGEGCAEVLLDKIQERYGISTELAAGRIDDLASECVRGLG